MEIRPVGVKLFHPHRQTDRQTDMTKLKVALHNFANMPKIESYTKKQQDDVDWIHLALDRDKLQFP
jgi:hypothetical protein